MKLELKHLAPYLPYGLKGTYCGHGEPCQESELEALHYRHPDSWEITIKLDGGGIDTDVLFYFKPHLRPLSDLTKEIGHNGKRFMPVDRLTPYSQGRIDMDMWDKVIPDVPFVDSQKLFEWHFDVFGLIDQGLAIDLNTINK